MIKKLLSIILVFACLFFAGTVVIAEKEDKVVEPNIYKKREINIRNYFRDNLSEPKSLPEEQKDLTFEPPAQTESEQIIDELFQSSVIETNTITSKAAQLELFSEEAHEVKRDTEEEEGSGDSNLLMILMIMIAAVIVAMLFILIPRLQHTEK